VAEACEPRRSAGPLGDVRGSPQPLSRPRLAPIEQVTGYYTSNSSKYIVVGNPDPNVMLETEEGMLKAAFKLGAPARPPHRRRWPAPAHAPGRGGQASC
jgi:hypothetical protein